MKVSTVAILLLCVSAVLCQRPPQATLYPYYFDGFDTVVLDDMSFVTEIHVQTYPPNNWTLFIFGSSTVRTIYPHERGYAVGATPNENWHLPFIDLHTAQNGSDIWGFGPVDPIGIGAFRQDFGYNLDIAIVTTKQGGGLWRFTPLGFEGTFFAVRPVIFGPEILGYFVGFFPMYQVPSVLHFGVLRARFNISSDTGPTSTPNWAFNYTHDVAKIVNESQFTTYNAFFKPIVYHLWNVTGDSNPNNTYTVVVDPGTRAVNLVLGSINPGTNLTTSPLYWRPPTGLPYGGISSAAMYYPYSLLVLGIAVPGIGAGAIAFVHVYNLTTRGVLNLPANYSDPKALVIDEANGTLYVAMNGGGAVLRINIHTMAITGYQNTPPYLERAWAGHATPEHVYFITNEQHSKVFRVHKESFCTTQCPEFGYCEHGHCKCQAPWFELLNNRCEFITLVNDRNTIKKEKTGEAVLGVFFALALVAAAVGWFLVWRSKRGGYQAV